MRRQLKGRVDRSRASGGSQEESNLEACKRLIKRQSNWLNGFRRRSGPPQLRRLSLEESWRRHYQLYLRRCEEEAGIER